MGTTGLTLHARGRQHLEALLGGNLKYPMTKHYKEKHPGQEAANGLVIKPVTGFLQQNISCYLTEAMEIARAQEKPGEMLNYRGERSRDKVRRLVVGDI